MAVVQTAVYNWRLSLVVRREALLTELRRLEWRREELLVDRALLLSPDRLSALADSLGMEPLPLERFTLVDPGAGTGGETGVCMEQ